MGCRGSEVRIFSPRPLPHRPRLGRRPELKPRPRRQRGTAHEGQPELTSPKRLPEQGRQATQTELFRLLIEEATDYAIFILDRGGRVATWNEGAQRLQGYAPEEIIGRHFSPFYPKEAVDTGWPDRELEEAARLGRFEDEGWRVRKDGTLFWANVIITALRDSSGTLQGFSKITRDLSERKRHEEMLRESEERFRLLLEGVEDY